MSVQDKFSVGDKVKYVGRGWDETFERGVVYLVTEIWSTGCDVDGCPVSSLFCDDFELVEDAPKVQDNSWYEDGELPPVNAKCIFTGVDVAVEGTIVAHVEYRGRYSAIIQCDGDWWTGEIGEFRPWYSDEEIAKQEREKVVQKMVSCAGERMSFRSICESLYDAGLRFEEEVE